MRVARGHIISIRDIAGPGSLLSAYMLFCFVLHFTCVGFISQADLKLFQDSSVSPVPLEAFTRPHPVNDITYLIPLFMSLAGFSFLTIKIMANENAS